MQVEAHYSSQDKTYGGQDKHCQITPEPLLHVEFATGALISTDVHQA